MGRAPLTRSLVACDTKHRLFQRVPVSCTASGISRKRAVVMQASVKLYISKSISVGSVSRLQVPFFFRLANRPQKRFAPVVTLCTSCSRTALAGAIVVFHRAADVDAARRHFLECAFPSSGSTSRAIAASRAVHASSGRTLRLRSDGGIPAHFHLQIFARAEMREHAALAHLHPFGQQADRQAFEPVAACQVQCRVENRDPRLFAFSHDPYRSHVTQNKIERPYYCSGRSRNKLIF